MRRPGTISLLALLALPLLVGTTAGCPFNPFKSKKPKLRGAVTEIPVYAPSTFVDRGSASTGEHMSDLRFHVYHWELATEDAPAKVVAFYEKALPQAEKRDEPDSDYVVFLYVPAGFGEGENVEIAVYRAPRDGKTKILISEEVLKEKHTDDDWF